MIAYVDTSTLLKRLLDEEGSARADLIWQNADVLASAVIVIVEAHAALAQARRLDRLSAAQHRTAKVELALVLEEITFVEVTTALLDQASRVAESEGLRAYDAVHLAAALTVEATVLTSADAALCDAASHLGLRVANPLDSIES